MLYVGTNSFGDVIGLYSGTGSLLVKYEYDAWGNIISETNASGGNLSTTAQGYSDICAIRYRGYYYDKDTGLYYLQSRYYDPEVGRFLNVDGTLNGNGDIIGFNMFAYCGNNPVNYSDPTGYKFIETIWNFAKKTFSKVVDWAVDKGISLLKKSPNKTLKEVGYILDTVNNVKSYNDAVNIASENLKNAEIIKKQYVEDIITIGNNGIITETPDKLCFPDVDNYKKLCNSSFAILSDNPIYSIDSVINKELACNMMIEWDTKTTVRIGLVTGFYECIDIFERAIS